MKAISSLQHPLAKHLVKLRLNRDYRKQKNCALITGLKLIKEIANDIPLKTLLVEENYELPAFISQETVVYRVTNSLLKKISGLENPEPVAAEVTLPSFSELSGKNFLIVFDGIADPGNLGTLLRTALALGWEGVFLAPNCTDPFNDKALRAAKGATFRLPMQTGSWDDLKKMIRDKKIQPYVADMKGKSIEELKCKPPLMLILSNESLGASDEAKEISLPIAIPMSGKVESLNVAAAGAILMYELKKRPS
jgi:TrmH family RNA methyltransferase